MCASYQPLDGSKESWTTPIVAYCIASISMTLLNKFVLSGFNMSMVFFILASQAAMCSGMVMLLSKYVPSVSFRRLDKRTVKQFFPVSVAMATMLFTSGKALEFMNIPVFTIFKNLTIILIALGDKYLNKSIITRPMALSFLLMILSSLCAAGSDYSFSVPGYFWTLLNVLSSAYYVLFIRQKIRRLQFREYDTVFYNNILVLPMFTIISLFMDDWQKFLFFPLT